ncbi:MAG: AzlD domain-containing protein [Oscillospiraceae bacterium]|nr:AzlD domain-containing protein [Oscillospiraceae bacterium]
MHGAVLVAAMAAVTALLRALPFLIFRKDTPAYITYLGKVLPPAMIGMLVVYCLRQVEFTRAPFGLPELAAGLCVAGLQIWKRNSIVSILGGTAVYMLLIRIALN